ncbi:phospholipase-like protein [Tanacetum coccineum]
MERYDQTFKCTCERGNVVLRTSRKPYSYGKQYYACPCSKPGTQDRGCGYFMWMDDLRLHISSSSGSSAPLSSNPGTLTRPSYSPGTSRSAQNLKKAECSNCKFLAEKIKTLEAKIKILEGVLEMERHPEKHTLESAAILHELYNDIGKLDDDFGVAHLELNRFLQRYWFTIKMPLLLEMPNILAHYRNLLGPDDQSIQHMSGLPSLDAVEVLGKESVKSDTEENDTSGSDSKDLDYDPKHDELYDDYEHILKDVLVSINNFNFNPESKHDLNIAAIEVHEHDPDVIDYDSFGSELDDEIDSDEELNLQN